MHKTLHSRDDIYMSTKEGKRNSLLLRIVPVQHFKELRNKLKRAKKDYLLQPVTAMST